MKTNPLFVLTIVATSLLAPSCEKDVVRTEAANLNYALQFDGMTTFVEIPPIAAQRPAQVTVEVKAMFDTVHLGNMPLIAEAYLDQWNQASGYSVKVQDDQVHWKLATAANVANAFRPTFRPLPNRWYHFACTYDGQVGRVYVDDSLLYQDQRAFTIFYGIDGFWIGRAYDSYSGGNVMFRGLIDEVRVWNFAKTKAQIDALRRSTLTGSESGLVGYWNFDGDVDQFDIAKDRSASQNSGYVSGRVTLVRSTAFANQ